jgi:uncharacterized coiled-coil protein SlyX
MGNENNNNNEQQPPGRWGRLGKAISWAVNSAIRLILLVLLLAVLTGAVWLGLQEMDRSLTSLSRRLSAETQKVAQLRLDVDRLGQAHGEQARQILAVETTVSGYERRLLSVEGQLADDIARQNRLLADLELRLTAVISAANQNRDNLASLSQGLNALQGDLNANTGEIDALGGQLDETQVVLANLTDGLADVQAEMVSPESEVARLQQLIALYRVSELIARARLRLVEGNGGLALLDVEMALTAVETLSASSPPLAEALIPVETRLSLAADNLPANPLDAARDLESAWERLDGMVAVLIVPAASPDDFAFAPVEEEEE